MLVLPSRCLCASRCGEPIVWRNAPSIRHASQLSPRLDLQQIDTTWQEKWKQKSRPRAHRHGRATAAKSYVLPMFAYPSGSLHMGHLRVYTISDVLARYRRMQGSDVLHPTGWDAFGLPAENAAIERGVHPAEWTKQNIAKMKEQLISMNTSFDWNAEISTCLPDFYEHTQKIFLLLYKRGLAYQDEALVNYDPIDKTVLANEQVDNNGRSWRSGAVVEQIKLRQWFFRITAFKEALLDDLAILSRDAAWPERVLTQQRNWLGRSKGAKIEFLLTTKDGESLRGLDVFTTRPDTLFGVQYLALSLSHPIVLKLAQSSQELQAFINKKASFAPDSKAGFELPLRAFNPANHLSGYVRKSLPVFAAPYVLEDYGEGAVMGVPTHDSRDLAFWKQHRPKDLVPIVVAADGEKPSSLTPVAEELHTAYTQPGVLTSLCSHYAGKDSVAAGVEMVRSLARRGCAEEVETWRLRDWLVSRQRYWGAPIPIVHCSSCGAVPVPDDQLPVKLPTLPASIRGQRGNPLDSIEDWVNVSCPKCGKDARRETDTMDTFVDSSWYYARFPDAHNDIAPFSLEASKMLPVDTYVGGVEHAILHLLYARFMHKFLVSEGLINQDSPEPFKQLIAQGMVHGKTFSDPDTGRFLLPHQVVHTTAPPSVKHTGKPATMTYEKMSKSKHNGVDPSECMRKYGADATRAHILFAAPISEVLQWDEEKIVGIQRWFHRIYRLVTDLSDVPLPKELNLTHSVLLDKKDLSSISDASASIILITQNTIRSVTHTLEKDIYSLNTVISDLTKLTNAIHDTGLVNIPPAVGYTSISILLRLLAPIAPAFTSHCWQLLAQFEVLTHLYTASSTDPEDDVPDPNEADIFSHPWPKYSLTPELETILSSRRTMEMCAVQINGKLKFTVEIPVSAASATGDEKQTSQVSKAEKDNGVVEKVLATENGQSWLKGRNQWEKRKRVIVVDRGKGKGVVLNVVFPSLKADG